VRNTGGEYNQLSTSLLQIENEFYGTIRPKRIIRTGERPLHALRERGVEYVEVRCMDLDPFEQIGIAASTARFLDVFLLHCLLIESPHDTPQEISTLARNQERVAARGREPGLRLEHGTSSADLVEWGHELLDEFDPIAEALDSLRGGHGHKDAVRQARAALADASQLPSARIIKAMATQSGSGFVQFIGERSEATRRALLKLPWSHAEDTRFRAVSDSSLREQHAFDASDEIPFEVFRQQYLSSEQLQP
jgi:glutamate--cysteine ligase